MTRSLFLALCAALLAAGCTRSPAEQLAYLHAEQQYRINLEASQRYHAGDTSEPLAAQNELPIARDARQ